MTESKPLPKLKLSKKSIVLSLNPPATIAKVEEKKEDKVTKLKDKKPAAPIVANAPKAKNIKEHTIIEPDIYNKILRHFREKYPNCFSYQRKPLAIGIFHQVVGECKDLGITEKQLKSFFTAYCSTTHYRQLMNVGAERVDLLGNTSGFVIEKEVRKVDNTKKPADPTTPGNVDL